MEAKLKNLVFLEECPDEENESNIYETYIDVFINGKAPTDVKASVFVDEETQSVLSIWVSSEDFTKAVEGAVRH